MTVTTSSSLDTIISTLQGLEIINAKADLVSVIGAPATSGDGVSQLVADIQAAKDTLGSKSFTHTNTDPLQDLANSVYGSGDTVPLSTPVRKILNSNQVNPTLVDTDDSCYTSINGTFMKYNKDFVQEWTLSPTYTSQMNFPYAVAVGDFIIGCYRNTSGNVMFFNIMKDGTSPNSYFPSQFFSTYNGFAQMICSGNTIIALRWSGTAGILTRFDVDPTTGVLTQVWEVNNLTNAALANSCFVANLQAFTLLENGLIVMRSIATGAILWSPGDPSVQRYHFASNDGTLYYMTGTSPSYTINKKTYQSTTVEWTRDIYNGYIIGGDDTGVIATPYDPTHKAPQVTKYDLNGNVLWSMGGFSPVADRPTDQKGGRSIFADSTSKLTIEYANGIAI